MILLNWILLIASNAFLLLMLVSSILEKENRAVFISIIGMLLSSAMWLGLIFRRDLAWVQPVNVLVFTGLGLFGLVSLVKWFPSLESRDMAGAVKMDERDYMFSRNNLKDHPDLAQQYYSVHPEKREVDELIHKKPDIGKPGALYYDEYYSAIFDASFGYLGKTRDVTWAKPAPQKKELDMKRFIKGLKDTARYYGAVDIGFTKLKPYHLYSHRGRHAETWGDEVKIDHPTAIAIIVAMDVEMIKGGPALPAILESSRHYVEAAKIASIVAEYIRYFGYDALAHTDGNYHVMCVPVAVDAGLGELGRLGLMMHPIYGPCIRISVVTTELELTGDDETGNPEAASIYNFCEICKKCADNCPTNSISKEAEPSSRGFRHWSINQETCYSYWKNIGTDCGFCIGVCPYTKPNTLLHKLVRFYISRNPINQRIALFLDDLFYGRKQRICNKNPDPIICAVK